MEKDLIPDLRNNVVLMMISPAVEHSEILLE